MMRRGLTIGAVIAALLGSTVFAVEGEPSVGRSEIEFEGRQWRCDSPDRAVVREFGGKTALYIQGERMTSSAFLADVEFGSGTIEVDMAAPGRSTPGVGFRGREDGNWRNTIMFNRWRGEDADKSEVIEQAVVTRRARTVLLANTRRPGHDATDPRLDADEWFHVKVTIERDHVKAFLNGTKDPSIELGAMFEGDEQGVLGLCGGDCYFANFGTRMHHKRGLI